MNLLFIGGSNSVMSPGYVGFVVEHLRQSGHEITSAPNLSIGANNCLIGLEQAKLLADLSRIDKVVIEFAVNDYKMAVEGGQETWKRGYEGLVRYLLSQNPHLQIFNLMLARCDGSAARINRVRAGMAAITRHYAKNSMVYLVDFDRYLRKKTGNNPLKLKKHYLDNAHYSRELGARLMARFLARSLVVKPKPVSAMLPPPLHANAFDDAGLYKLAETEGAAVREFRNSRFQRLTHQLMPGQKLTVDLPGPLIGLSFVSTFDSHAVLIQEQGEKPVLIYTAYSDLVKVPDKFLIKNFVLSSKTWSDAAALGPRRVTLTAIGKGPALKRFQKYHRDRYKMIEARGEGSAAYLGNLMYYQPDEAEAVTAPRTRRTRSRARARPEAEADALQAG